MNNDHLAAGGHRHWLRQIAHRAMIERGLEPDFPKAALRELEAISEAPGGGEGVRDLRSRLWCSIDNDDSLDLDQLTVAAELPGGALQVWVAIADVDVCVKKFGPLDNHAQRNTTSVYTAGETFSMLPEKLSHDLTSLALRRDRLAVAVEMEINGDGELRRADVYRALVHNWAQLTYRGVGAWLEGRGPLPEAAAAVPGMDQQLRLQDGVAQKLKKIRRAQGALDLETIEAKAIFQGEAVSDLEVEEHNRARDLIEDLMIAANGAIARFLEAQGSPSLRRVVRAPERWARIVALAQNSFGEHLPDSPDSRALEDFLLRRKAADPLHFPDLSLTIVKLLGRGEYVVEYPGEPTIGHFGLAVEDYAHSTAPNRRFPDLITQRLVKATLAGGKPPYLGQELAFLAAHCTKQEDAANKVERQVRKSAAAMLLAHRIGDRFEGIITGASVKGTWVRLFKPPVEGRVARGWQGLDVGDRVEVKLLSTDVQRGYIDFARV